MKERYDAALLSGGFDPVHQGHLKMIKGAKKIAKKVIILLNSDDWLMRKKSKPFMNEVQRKAILEEFKSVEEIIIQKNDSDDSSNNAIKDFVLKNPNQKICYCNGGDRSSKNKIREAKVCEELGIKLVFGVGGKKKIASSSKLSKNHLGEIEKRPWGNYHIIANGDDYQIKEINVLSKRKQSLQKHKYRSECWQIIKGEAKVYLEEKIFNLSKGDTIFIAKGKKHRIENIGKKDLTLVEIQMGKRIFEEDIIRIEDDYGR